MLDSLYTLPDLAISAIFGTVMFIAVAFLPYLLRPLLRVTTDKDTVDFATRAQTTVIGFLAIVLSFSLVNAQLNLRNVDALVSREAAAINQMDRLLLRYSDPKVAEMRSLLAAYAQSIVNVDWPLLTQGNQSELASKSSQTFGPLSRAVYSITPLAGRQTEIYGQILKQIDDLSEMRSQRIEAANIRLPDIFWNVIFALFSLLVVLAVLIEPTLGRLVAIGGQAMAVALLLSLVFIFDQPFKGQTRIGPDAIIKVIGIMKNRTS
jgi:hypothetical protein